MTPLPFRRLLPFGFALGGLAFAAWLALFFHDPNRPTSPQERADRLAASNYLAGELAAPVPPSPSHWAQRLVWQDPVSGARHPLARQDAAIVLAASGANPRLAGVIACGLAAAALGWLTLAVPSLPLVFAVILPSAAILGFAHALAWQTTNPAPFLFLASSALALGAWLRFREAPAPRTAWLLGLGIGAMLLGDVAPTVVFATTIIVDLIARRRATGPAAGAELLGLGRAALIVAVLLVLFGLRNHQTTGSFFQSPAQAYAEAATTAPNWFWQSTRAPQEQLDPVLERYDELVAIPQARWEKPVYRKWMERLNAGANQAGGLVLVLFALSAALFLPANETRPGLLVLAGGSALALLRHDIPPEWWAMAAPAIVSLLALGAARLASATALTRRVVATGVALHCVVLSAAPQARVTDAEFVFEKRLGEVSKKLREQPGRHLVFVSIDNSCDGRLEPAKLPRDWSGEPILFARDLGKKKNAELVAAMPDYKPSEIKVLPGGIGLKAWKAEEPAAPSK